MKDDKKRINLISVDPVTHEWLVSQANRTGVPVADYAGLLLDKAYINYPETQKEPQSPDETLYQLSAKYDRQQRRQQLVLRMAAVYLDGNEDDTTVAEDLATACDAAGMDYDEVIKSSKDNPFTSLVEHKRHNGKQGACIDWLMKVMTENKVIAVSEIVSVGEQMGFNYPMIKNAKGYINRSSAAFGIKSIRIDVGWQWVLEERLEFDTSKTGGTKTGKNVSVSSDEMAVI